jgi:hypothetical protein
MWDILLHVREQKLRKQREEEEFVPPYMGDPSAEGYEFKILRSNLGRFGSIQVLRAALDEESRAGWELVEKLDNYRLRLRRHNEARERDADQGFDAYRTYYGMGNFGHTLLLVVVACQGLAAAIAYFNWSRLPH